VKADPATEVASGTSQPAGQDARPQLLTQEEAAQILRLDRLGLKDPKETLRYLRRTGQLGYVKVAGKVLIPMGELELYVRRHSARSWARRERR